MTTISIYGGTHSKRGKPVAVIVVLLVIWQQRNDNRFVTKVYLSLPFQRCRTNSNICDINGTIYDFISLPYLLYFSFGFFSFSPFVDLSKIVRKSSFAYDFRIIFFLFFFSFSFVLLSLLFFLFLRPRCYLLIFRKILCERAFTMCMVFSGFNVISVEKGDLIFRLHTHQNISSPYPSSFFARL